MILVVGGRSRTMTGENERNERWVSVCMYSHTIVYFYIRTSKNLVNVGSSWHKLSRHLQFCVGDTDSSGQNWSDTTRHFVADMSRHVGDMSATFPPKPSIVEVIPATAKILTRLGGGRLWFSSEWGPTDAEASINTPFWIISSITWSGC